MFLNKQIFSFIIFCLMCQQVGASTSLSVRDTLFDNAGTLGQSEHASTTSFLFASKKRLQYVDKKGDFVPKGHEKLTHKNAVIFKGIFIPNPENGNIFPGVLSEVEVPAIISFATVGSNIKAPGLAIKFVDKDGSTQDVLTAASVANEVGWDSTMSNVLPPAKGFKEKLVLHKFSKAANVKYLSVEHIGVGLKKLDVELGPVLYLSSFNKNDASDFSKLEKLKIVDKKYFVAIYGSDNLEGKNRKELGTLYLTGKGKKNQKLRFKHHLVDKK